MTAANATFLRGSCVSLAGGEFPLAPFVGICREAAHGPLAGALAPADGDARARLAVLFPGVFQLGQIVPPPEFSPSHVHELLLGLLERLAAAAPGGLVVVLEDLHWADASTRDALEY